MTGGNLESAVILHGLVHRSLRHTVESLQAGVIQPLADLGPVEVFFHSWEVTALNNPRAGEAGEALDSADAIVMLIRFRKWNEETLAKFDAAVKRGGRRQTVDVEPGERIGHAGHGQVARRILSI